MIMTGSGPYDRLYLFILLRKAACLMHGFSFWKRPIALKKSSGSQTFVDLECIK